MTVLSRISVHFGATQRTHGEKLHTTTQKETKGVGGEPMWTSKTKKQTHTSQQHHSSLQKTTTTNKENHIYLAQDSHVRSQHKIIKPKGNFWVSLRHEKLDVTASQNWESVKNTQSRHTPVETQVCTNSFWMTWSTHITALCVVQITHGGHITVNVSRLGLCFCKTVLSSPSNALVPNLFLAYSHVTTPNPGCIFINRETLSCSTRAMFPAQTV